MWNKSRIIQAILSFIAIFGFAQGAGDDFNRFGNLFSPSFLQYSAFLFLSVCWAFKVCFINKN
jgi:hypothetical protein